jgi:hypothetical protein
MPAVFCRARNEIEWIEDILLPGGTSRIENGCCHNPLEIALPLEVHLTAVPQPAELAKRELTEFLIAQAEVIPRDCPVILPTAGIVL